MADPASIMRHTGVGGAICPSIMQDASARHRAGLCCSCLFKWYIAVAAYYVNLLCYADDCPAFWANVLDAAVFTGLPPVLDRCGGFLTALKIMFAVVTA